MLQSTLKLKPARDNQPKDSQKDVYVTMNRLAHHLSQSRVVHEKGLQCRVSFLFKVVQALTQSKELMDADIVVQLFQPLLPSGPPAPPIATTSADAFALSPVITISIDTLKQLCYIIHTPRNGVTTTESAPFRAFRLDQSDDHLSLQAFAKITGMVEERLRLPVPTGFPATPLRAASPPSIAGHPAASAGASTQIMTHFLGVHGNGVPATAVSGNPQSNTAAVAARAALAGSETVHDYIVCRAAECTTPLTTTVLNEGAAAVFISTSVFRTIVTDVLGVVRSEVITGGDIYGGYSNDSEAFLIWTSTEPYSYAERKTNSFSIHERFAKSTDHDIRLSDPSAYRLGAWHSHPQACPAPSEWDILYYQDQLETFRQRHHAFDFFLVLIATLAPGGESVVLTPYIIRAGVGTSKVTRLAPVQIVEDEKIPSMRAQLLRTAGPSVPVRLPAGVSGPSSSDIGSAAAPRATTQGWWTSPEGKETMRVIHNSFKDSRWLEDVKIFQEQGKMTLTSYFMWKTGIEGTTLTTHRQPFVITFPPSFLSSSEQPRLTFTHINTQESLDLPAQWQGDAKKFVDYIKGFFKQLFIRNSAAQ